MTTESKEPRAGLPSTDVTSEVPTSVQLGPSTALDLSWLPEAERRALLADYAKGMLDINRRAQELHVDVGALRSTLQTLSSTSKEVAAQDQAVTISHAQTTSIGRTEILIGNTEAAKRGKLSKTQTGETDYTWLYVIAGLIALVLVVSALSGG